MRYLFLLHDDDEAVAALTAEQRHAIVEEHMAFSARLREQGKLVLGEPLDGSAAVVRPGNDPLVTDGPFAATKEAIGGMYVLECESRDEALELAAQMPRSPGLAIEVLKVAEM
jgi:hypothetical protein